MAFNLPDPSFSAHQACLPPFVPRCHIAVQHECIPQAILGMDVICQAKSGMGKTAVFVISTLQQLEPVDGQVRGCEADRQRARGVWSVQPQLQAGTCIDDTGLALQLAGPVLLLETAACWPLAASLLMACDCATPPVHRCRWWCCAILVSWPSRSVTSTSGEHSMLPLCRAYGTAFVARSVWRY